MLDRTNDEDLQLDVKEGHGCLGPCIGCMQGCFQFYCCCHGASTFLCGALPHLSHSALACKQAIPQLMPDERVSLTTEWDFNF